MFLDFKFAMKGETSEISTKVKMVHITGFTAHGIQPCIEQCMLQGRNAYEFIV